MGLEFRLDKDDRVIYSMYCNRCVHFIDQYRCEAFDLIPAEIWNNQNDHKQPYEGDKGIRFEPKEKVTVND